MQEFLGRIVFFSNTTIETGLKLLSVLDENEHKIGIAVSDEMHCRHSSH